MRSESRVANEFSWTIHLRGDDAHLEKFALARRQRRHAKRPFDYAHGRQRAIQTRIPRGLTTAQGTQLRLFRRQCTVAFQDFRFGCELGRLAAEDDAIWFFGQRFDKRFRVRRDNFQVQKRDMQLF